MKDEVAVDVHKITPDVQGQSDQHDALRLTKICFLLTRKEDRERVIGFAEQLLARNVQ
jgi:hypothetical protein